MSIRSIIVIRESHDVLHEAVLLALDLDWDIKTMDTVFNNMSSEYYIICERKGSQRSLFGVKTKLSNNIQLTEYSSNTEHNLYDVFHTFKYKQYQKNSTEDKQQIQELANLILQFCRERMYIGEPLCKKTKIYLETTQKDNVFNRSDW